MREILFERRDVDLDRDEIGLEGAPESLELLNPVLLEALGLALAQALAGNDDVGARAVVEEGLHVLGGVLVGLELVGERSRHAHTAAVGVRRVRMNEPDDLAHRDASLPTEELHVEEGIARRRRLLHPVLRQRPEADGHAKFVSLFNPERLADQLQIDLGQALGRETKGEGAGDLKDPGKRMVDRFLELAVAPNDREKAPARIKVRALEIAAPPDLAGVAHDVDFPLDARDPIGDLSHDGILPRHVAVALDEIRGAARRRRAWSPGKQTGVNAQDVGGRGLLEQST